MAKRNPRFYLDVILGVFALISLSGYALFQTRELVRGPELTITEPVNGSDFNSPEITISGQADNISFITLNGLQIFTDESGKFARRLLLMPGYNVITLEARDKFNRTVKKSLQLTRSL